MLDNWTSIKGKSKDKNVSVVMSHGRRSGDPWTSVFNSFLNWLITRFCTQLEEEEILLMVMGDDNLYGTDRELRLEAIENRYKGLGMKCEVVLRDCILDATFCSGRFWLVDGRLIWGSLPFRALSKFGLNHHRHTPKLFKRLLYGNAMSMLPIAGHVPVFGAFLRAIADSGEENGYKPYYDNRGLNPDRIMGGVALYPSSDTYEQFCQLYNVDLLTVLNLEEFIEFNICLDNAPWCFSDREWLDWFQIDVGCENVDYTTHQYIDPEGIYHLITEEVPLLEEKEKLQGVNSIEQAISAGWKYGEEENVENETQGHEFLHAFFSAVSFIHFPWGVALHRAYNRFAIKYDREPCAKKKKKKKKQAPRAPPRQKRGAMSIKAYADMISDPCNATLLPGINGTEEGILSRLKSTHSLSSTDNGYVLWCPTYFGDENEGKGSIFFFRDQGTTTSPLNTVADPLGSFSTTSTVGNLSQAGAAQFCASATVADARVVSACIRMRYTGKVVDAAGEIAYIENLSTKALLEGNGGFPVSVDSLFNLSTKVTRLGLDVCEVSYRPDPELADFFKTTNDNAITEGKAGVEETVMSSEALRFGPTWVGFAWRGVGLQTLAIDAIQNVEWRPEVSVGFVAVPPRTVHETSMIGKATRWLDRNYPGWSVTLGAATKKGINMAARSVYAYGANRLGLGPVGGNMITY
jgi:hypothetical protein